MHKKMQWEIDAWLRHRQEGAICHAEERIVECRPLIKQGNAMKSWVDAWALHGTG